MALGQLGFQAHLGMAAARGTQTEVGAAGPGAVGNFSQRRSFKALAHIGIQVGVFAQVRSHAQHGIDGTELHATAVVWVALGDEAVIHTELHPAAAHTGHHAPVLVGHPVGLGKHPGAGHRAGFVALESPLLAQVVDVTQAVFFHLLVFHAGSGLHLALLQRKLLVVFQAHAAVGAIQFDDATGSGGQVLGRQRNGQPVGQVARSPVDRGRDGAGGIGLVHSHHTQLVLRHFLACVVVGGVDHGLPGVGLELGAGQPQRIAGHRLVEQVHHHREAGLVGRIPPQLRVELAAFGSAVVAVAIGLEAGVVQQVVQLAGLPGCVQADLAQAVRAHHHRAAHLRRGRAVCGEHLHHTARRVAVELGQWPAQHLDALGTRQADGRSLALAIGHGGRNAVDYQARAPDAERRPCARSTDGQLQILRIVLPVERRNAGHPVHGLREIDLRAGGCDGVAPHGLDGGRCIEALLLGTAGTHHHFGQSLGLGRTSGGGTGQNHGLGNGRVAGMEKKVQGCLRWWLSAPPCVWGGVRPVNARSPHG